MTRKDYVILARILKGWRDDRKYILGREREVFRGATIAEINGWLQGDNPRFDPVEFWKAVGGT